jgi:hypothetical protein
MWNNGSKIGHSIKINLTFVDVTDEVYLEYCPVISFKVQYYQELIC